MFLFFATAKSNCQLCHGNTQRSICQDVDNYGFAKLFSSCASFSCALQIRAVRRTRQFFATYHYLSFHSGVIHVSLVYYLRSPARDEVVKMNSAEQSAMQTSNNF